MSLDPPKVLVELSFLCAVADRHHAHHVAAATRYLELVDDYEAEQVLLYSVGDHLDGFRKVAHGGVFAPIDRLWVGHQHRRAAARSAAANDPAFALTLVMADRHQVRRIATLDERFAAFDLEIEPLAQPVIEPPPQSG